MRRFATFLLALLLPGCATHTPAKPAVKTPDPFCDAFEQDRYFTKGDMIERTLESREKD